MAKPKSAQRPRSWDSFVLELVGSILFLWVFYSGVTVLVPNFNALWGASAGGMWLPFFAGVALISSASLFFLSFANLSMSTPFTIKAATYSAMAAGVALTALSWGSVLYQSVSLIGFSAAYIGAGMSMGSLM